MNGLKLSNVPMVLSATSPPFGASGLTQGKWVKSGGSAGAPSSDMPWVRDRRLRQRRRRGSQQDQQQAINCTHVFPLAGLPCR